jgi:hypothetical protein
MRKLLTAVATAAAAAVALAAPATTSAGGWVVVSLDSTPAVQAGEDSEIGFTVLRHGVTPERADDLAVVVTGADGAYLRFDAVPDGAPGHYVATVAVPAAGDYEWKVTGAFVDAELGALAVAAPDSGSASWAWTTVQWGSAALAALMAGLVAIDLRRSRRQRGNVAAAT